MTTLKKMINIIHYKKYLFKPGYFVFVSITNIFYFDFFYVLYMINILKGFLNEEEKLEHHRH